MEAYTSFAQVYDLFQDNIPYGEWADYLKSLLNEYGVKTDWFWIWAAALEASLSF